MTVSSNDFFVLIVRAGFCPKGSHKTSVAGSGPPVASKDAACSISQ